METNFVDAAEAGDAVAFQNHFETRMKEKIDTVLDALKIEVARNFLNAKPEDNGEEQVAS